VDSAAEWEDVSNELAIKCHDLEDQVAAQETSVLGHPFAYPFILPLFFDHSIPIFTMTPISPAHPRGPTPERR
jgi:hypothetical protein